MIIFFYYILYSYIAYFIKYNYILFKKNLIFILYFIFSSPSYSFILHVNKIFTILFVITKALGNNKAPGNKKNEKTRKMKYQ
jgi:hypothetical protein